MDIKQLQIDKIGLSVRSTNALRRADVHTVGEMLSYTEESLSEIRNLGKKSIEEILKKIEECRLAEQTGTNLFAPDLNVTTNAAVVDYDEWILSENGQQYISTYLQERKITIDALELLSVRAYNILSLTGYSLLHQVIFLTEQELLQLPRMDSSIANEILRLCHHYLQDNRELILRTCEETSAPEQVPLKQQRLDPEYRDAILSYIKANDLGIAAMGLSARPKNRLLQCGHTMLSDIIFISREELQSIPNMGAASIEEVLKKIDTYLDTHEQAIIAIYHGDRSALWSDDKIRSMILDIYKIVGFGGLSLEEISLRLQLPDDVTQEKLKKIIGNLLADKELEYVDFRCYRVYRKFSDYLKICTAVNDRSRDIVEQRLLGKTLEEIAQEYDLTRERVRQIIKRDVEKIRSQYTAETGLTWFDEDYYCHLYETYELDKKDGEQWLGIPQSVFRYLELSDIKNGKKDLLSALEDYTLDAGLRLKIKNYLNRNKLYIDDRWIEKKRADLEEYVVRAFCTDDVSFESFIQIYNDFLVREDVAYDEDIYYTSAVLRTRKNHLADARYLLWKQNETIRYYDIDGQDYSELLDTLNLESFENIELSTLKFVEEYPDIMAKYDIRNQYELHNLLRKIVPEGSYHDFCCGRMPEIKFGTFDRNSALLDLLIDHAPISTEDFIDLIHHEYGYDRGTIMGTYLPPLSDYYYQGTYSVNYKMIPTQRKYLVQNALTDDFYYIDEIRKVYANLFPEADPEEINPYSLKDMGFVVLSRYAIQHYDSLDAYYTDILTRNDIVDITPYRRRFVYVQTFYQKLYDLKRSMEIIEFEPNQIINIRKLERSGVDRDMLHAFCDSVYDFVEDGTYFSIQSLRKVGFESDLFELGFSEWFYANILASDDRFSSIRAYSAIILYKGRKNISIKSFELAIVQSHGWIDVYDLMTELTDLYGCCPDDRYDVVYKLQGTPVYHDQILDRLYASTEAYHKDLDDTEGI